MKPRDRIFFVVAACVTPFLIERPEELTQVEYFGCSAAGMFLAYWAVRGMKRIERKIFGDE